MASAADEEAIPGLPPVLQLGILSLLPPNDLALGGRLSCKDAAQRFSEPHHRTARLSQPLPGHAVTTAAEATTGTWCVEAAQTALRELTFRRKLLLLSTAAGSGCEANVEFAWQLLQPHVFPELLQTDHYLTYLRRTTELQVPDAGSAAVASGLAHLLPSLAQRCPGLLEPGATLEAAARHCDLAGLRAAWEAVGQRLLSSLESVPPFQLNQRLLSMGLDPEMVLKMQLDRQQDMEAWMAWTVWRRMMAAAAGSSAASNDAAAKMAWVLDRAHTHSRAAVEHAEVWGAAAASGDLARLRWLQERGFPWDGAEALAAVLKHADLGVIVRMEQEGGYLQPAGDESWGSEAVVCAAAGSDQDSVPKLLWLAGRGAALGSYHAVQAAAVRGNVRALQLLVGHWRSRGGVEAGQQEGSPPTSMRTAVESGSIPTAAWLLRQGCVLDPMAFKPAFWQGNLPLVRWLLQACDRPWLIHDAVSAWPANTAADAEALVTAVQLLAAAGWVMGSGNTANALEAAARRHPWTVLRALLGLRDEPAARQLSQCTPSTAAFAGCEATLEAMVELQVPELDPDAVYFIAVKARDRGTLTCLRRLGLPLHREVLVAAAKEGAPLFLLQWLVAHGAPCGGDVLQLMLGVLADGYPAPREQERREVEVWLRGRMGAEQQEEGVVAGVGAEDR